MTDTETIRSIVRSTYALKAEATFTGQWPLSQMVP